MLFDDRTRQWLVTRHEDVSRLLRDRRLGRTYLHVGTYEEMGRTAPPAWHEPFTTLNADGMLDREPPDHTRLRRLVLEAFTPRTVERLRARVQAIVDGLLDTIVGAGDVDLVETYLEPLPVTVIAELLAIPEADRPRLRPWSRDICRMYELAPSEASARIAVAASVEFSAYVRALARERLARPGDDLISALATARADGDRLTEDELIGTCVLLLNAGHEASVNGAGNGWWSLFRHPDQLARLRAEPGVAATAVEELLRFETPSTLFERFVLDDIEVAGVHLPRGTEVALQFASANRDPAAFHKPDRLILGRDPNPHVSFGAGIRLLPGRAACADGVADRVQVAAAPRPGDQPGGNPDLEADVCPAWARGPAGPDVTTSRRYIALGDSYTIGTGVRAAERFPDQLVGALAAATPDDPPLRLVANLGVNGYTSADLIRDELPALARLDPGFVTVLIGVNDVVQVVPEAVYATNVAVILDALLSHVPADRVVALAVPDYTVTPAGADYGDPSRAHDGIVAHNIVMARSARERSITFVDVYAVSREAARDRSLVAADGLHPSGIQYARWVALVAPVVRTLLTP